MADSLTESLSLKEMEKLTHFKEYVVTGGNGLHWRFRPCRLNCYRCPISRDDS